MAATPRSDKSKRLLVGFDLDGTLIDSSADIRHALKTVLTKQNLDPAIADRVVIGPPLRDMVRPFLTADEVRTKLDEVYEGFRAAYDHSGFPYTKPYSHASEVLNWLRTTDCVVFLATNKPLSGTEAVLEKYGWRPYFDFYLTPTSLNQTHLSKTDMLAHALKADAAQSTRAQIYLGDSPGDMGACQANGFTSVAATYGYHRTDELAPMSPHHQVDSLAAFQELLSGMLI